MINKTLFESAIAKESIVKQKLEASLVNSFCIKDDDLYYKDYLVLIDVPEYQHVIFDEKGKTVLFRNRTNIYKWQFNELNKISLMEYDIYLTTKYHAPKAIHSTLRQKGMNEFGQSDSDKVIYDNTDIKIELPYTSFEDYKKYSYNKHKHLTPISILLEGAGGNVVIDENDEIFVEYDENSKYEKILHVRYNHLNKTYSLYRTGVIDGGYAGYVSESPLSFEDITEFEKIIEYQQVDNNSHYVCDRFFFLLDSSGKKYMATVLKDGYDTLREIETNKYIDHNLNFDEYVVACKHIFVNDSFLKPNTNKVPKHVIEYIIDTENYQIHAPLGDSKDAMYNILSECPEIYYKYYSVIKKLNLNEFVARFSSNETLDWYLLLTH